MNYRKAMALFMTAGIININFLPLCAQASFLGLFKKKPVIKTQISQTDYRLDYVNLPWWDNFDDPILKDYIVMAIEKNHDLKIATLKVEEFNQMTKLQFAKELPSLTTAPGIGSAKMMGSNNADGMFSIPLIADYEIDIYGKNRDKTKAAKKQYEASKFAEKSAYISITSAVASTYLNIVKLDKVITIQKELIRSRKQIYDLTKKRNIQGVASTADTVRADKNLVLAKTDLIEYEKARNILLNQLAVLIGESPANAKELKRISFDELKVGNQIPHEISSDVILQRPDILNAEKQLEKAGFDVKVARKELLPNVQILGLVMFSSSSFSKTFDWKNALAGFGGGANWPIFTGGQKVINVRLKKNKYEQMLQNYQQVNLVAIQEVNDALSTLKLNNEKYKQDLKKLEMEEKDFHFNRLKYDQGVISYLDLLQFKENLLSINKLLAADQVDCYISSIGLYKATGNKL